MWTILVQCIARRGPMSYATMAITSGSKLWLLAKQRWSKKAESTRKDVERTFGMTQRRFRILHYPFTLRDVRDIPYVVVTCFTFHNMLFDYDDQFDEHADYDVMGII